MSGVGRAADAGAPDATALPALWLKRREDHRLRNGHPWVFSNEVDVARSPLAAIPSGDEVCVRASAGRVIGTALASPSSLICARLFSVRPDVVLDAPAIRERLAAALSLREHLFDEPYYRLVYAESDGLPGLVVDRFGDVLVAQMATAGMDRRRDIVLDALDGLLSPRAVVLRNDGAARSHEGLAQYTEVARGEDPGDVEIRENGAGFLVAPLAGQKTGWFFDHRESRAALARAAAGARVLDVFCYTGAWGIEAACAGAREVLGIDSSRSAVERARVNAERNGVAGAVHVEEADAFDALRALAGEGREFDVVVLDPPAFVRRRKDLKAGEEAYQRINRLALRLVADGGLLVSASCSFHLAPARLADLARRAARSLGLRLQIVGRGHQGADHPVLPGFPESEYLKAFTFRVTRQL